MLALAAGASIFLGFVLLMFLAVAYGYYTRRGSGIDQRPTDSRGAAPGAEGESHITTVEDDVERTVGTHGTR